MFLPISIFPSIHIHKKNISLRAALDGNLWQRGDVASLAERERYESLKTAECPFFNFTKIMKSIHYRSFQNL